MITDAYKTYLGRDPDPAGLRFWLGKMASGWTTSQIESGFLASTEYFPRVDTATISYNFEWVGQVYVSVLGRHPSLDEQLSWLHRMSMFGWPGLTRTQVAMDFLLSSENLAPVVDGYYRALLGRSLDPSGQATWVRILQTGGRDEDVIGAIIASDEYWGNVPSPA
ncbi:MAG TPA: DUF4214 domain-containing protein [Cellulomonadaceae bacterium]|nr:DUF4214 domain-containing protein [Cellulomonadaceae bacterium]